jgi:hypothetical protein
MLALRRNMKKELRMLRIAVLLRKVMGERSLEPKQGDSTR